MPEQNRRSFPGWTVAEAICRTVDRGILKHARETKLAWQNMSVPKRSSFYLYGPETDTSDNRRVLAARRLLRRLAEVQQYAADKLCRQLLSGRLIAWAYQNSRLTVRQPISPSAWKGLKLNVRQSGAIELTKAKNELLDIRIFPVLEAPDAVEHLAARTFAEAVQEFVFGDPQVVVRREHSIAMRGEPSSFGYSRKPYKSVWPATYGKKRTWASPVGFLNSGEEYYRPTRIADLTLEKRFGRLIQFLVDGKIVAEGTIAKTGERADIPRAYWMRSSSYVDLDNGDLLELNRHADGPEPGLSRPLFVGLMLRKPKEPAESRAPRVITSVASKSLRNVANKDQVEANCVLWLAELMRESLDRRPYPKSVFRARAIKKWRGKLSGHAFNRAWSKAIDVTGAIAWKAAGAPRKSARRKESSR